MSYREIDYSLADNGERQLWASVLLRAVYDAAGAIFTGDKPNRVIRDQAIEWLNAGGKDFRTVCTLAGFDPDFIHEAWKSGALNYEAIKATNADDDRNRRRRERRATKEAAQ